MQRLRQTETMRQAEKLWYHHGATPHTTHNRRTNRHHFQEQMRTRRHRQPDNSVVNPVYHKYKGGRPYFCATPLRN